MHSGDMPARRAPDGRGFLAHVLAQCTSHGEDFPGGTTNEVELEKLADEDRAHMFSLLAKHLHKAWVVGQKSTAPWHFQLLLEAIEAAIWHSRPSGELKRDLAVPWVVAVAGIEKWDLLASFVEHDRFGLADESTEDLALVVLRKLRQGRQVQTTVSLLKKLGARWKPDKPWTDEVAHSLAMVARNATSLDQLKYVQTWLERMLPGALADTRPAKQSIGLLSALAVMANRAMYGPALRRLGTRLTEEAPDTDLEPVLQTLLSNLAYIEGDEAFPLIERGCELMPQNALTRFEFAKLAKLRGQTGAELYALFDGLEATSPGFKPAISWLASCLFHGGYPELAERAYLKLGTTHSLSAQDARNLTHLQIRPKAEEVAAEPASTARFEAKLFGPFEPILTDLSEMLKGSPVHDKAPDADEITRRMKASTARLGKAIAAMPDLVAEDVCQLIRTLNSRADGGFRNISHFRFAFPHQQGRPYGKVDPRRCAAVVDGLCLHVATAAEVILTSPLPLAGAPDKGSFRLWLDLARFATEAWLERMQPKEASHLLGTLDKLAGPLGRASMLRLRESVYLHQGKLADASAVRRDSQPESTFVAVALKNWPEWIAAQGGTPELLLRDLPVQGTFEAIGPNFEVRSYSHATEAVRLDAVRLKNLQVRLSYGLVSPVGDLLLPHAWHLSMGKFPYSHPDVLNREIGGAMLREPAAVREVTEPVVVLGNMDASIHRNYYHWIVLILARVNYLRERGILDGRRLLLPEEISSWMRQSLVEIGVDEKDVIFYSGTDTVLAADALVVSPVEFAGPTLLNELRQTLWRRAGLDSANPPPKTRLLYISRDSKNRRPLVEEREIAEQAEELGFEQINPEVFSLLEQVRIFATARAVAGPPGAAFTNLAWSQPGVRVLSIFKEEVTLPPFVDLSVLLGQRHRWLLGTVAAGFESDHVINSPFTVSVQLARRQLLWASSADDEGEKQQQKLSPALESYRLQALANIGLGRSGALKLRPRILWLPVSENCNLRCIGCDDVVRGFKKIYVSPEEARQVLGGVAEGGGFNEIDLTGAEALLHPQLSEVIDVCRELHPAAKISVISNGTVPVKGKYKLAYSKLDSIGLSIDGSTKETFEAIRVGASFEKFLACVEDVVRLRAEVGRPAEIQLCFTACSLNLKELPDVIRLAAKLGVDSVFAQTMEMKVAEIQASIGHLHLDQMDARERHDLVDRARQVAQETGVAFHFSSGLYPADVKKAGGPSAEFRKKAAALGIGVAARSDEVTESVRMCQYPWTQAPAIKKTADGWRSLLCCYMSEATNRELEKRYDIEDVDRASIQQLVNSDGYWQFRESLVEGRTWHECGNCAAAKTHGPVRYQQLVTHVDALANAHELGFPGGDALRGSLVQAHPPRKVLDQLQSAIALEWDSKFDEPPEWLVGIRSLVDNLRRLAELERAAE